MKRVYMDLTDEQHKQFKQFAKQEKRTLKALLEISVNAYFIERKGVKKNEKKIRKN
jgi:hypothetical protein